LSLFACCLLAVTSSTRIASADRIFDVLGPATGLEPIPPISPDIPPRSGPPVVGPSGFPPASDLDGFYVWLGPMGNATTTNGEWDSAFGVDLAVLRIREHAPLSAVGGTFGFSKFTQNDGGRVWLDAVVGTRVAGRMMAGLTAGPVLEVSDSEHPRAGASVGVWAFVGVTPFVRVGVVSESGAFVELGIHVALPVFRR
jgi:hypothetical protein